MKKLLAVFVLFTAIAVVSFAQQKYALVIGNAKYIEGAPLRNAENDANDITAVLQGLGFTVDKLLNASLDQMEDAAVRLKNRLSVSTDSYGFFFYAGHGVQADGVNYLLPVDARIPDKNFLKTKAFAIQPILDMLNDAGNALNVIVLDACRDLPMAWSRSADRGLSVVNRQPAKSIIMYATAAGKTASDGTGRNGLFTQHLLTNLKTPGLDVKEIFNRTGEAVANASNYTQLPATYSSFYGTAYLGTKPSGGNNNAENLKQAEIHYKKGKDFYNNKDRDNAILELDEAIKLYPNYKDAYYARAVVYWYFGNANDKAIADFTQVLKIDPDDYRALYNRAGNYYSISDFDNAIADYTQLIKLNPTDYDSYRWRGRSYHKISNYSQALADYEKCKQLNYPYNISEEIENARNKKPIGTGTPPLFTF
jgi:tetratricopeptide (TPR) repeat protein